MGESNFRACEEVQWDGAFRRCSDLSGHERKIGRLQVWRSNKYSAQYPWVLRWSLEKSELIYVSREVVSAQSYQ